MELPFPDHPLLSLLGPGKWKIRTDGGESQTLCSKM